MQTPLHPMLVHLPLALAVLMPLLAGTLWWSLRRGWLPARAWWLAVAGQALLVGSSVVAMRSGEADEDRVERLVPEAALEQHEHAAERFTWAAGAVLVLALTPWLLRRRPAAVAWATGATTVAAVAVLWLGYRTGEAGGDLVWRHGAAAAFVPTDATPPPRDHDDR